MGGLLIIVINFRTPSLTIDCLRSVSACVTDVPGTRVVVVDNNSGDDSVRQLQAWISETHSESWITLMPVDKNYGFAGGNNRGLEALKSDVGKEARYVLLLNSDAIVDPGVLRRCHEIMEAEPNIGAMSCRLRNSDGSMQNAARKFPSPMRLFVGALGLPWIFPRLFGWGNLEDPGWDRMTVRRDVDWLGGAFLFIRRNVIDRIGGLDEDFFFYGEDIEFCHRIWRAGFRCHYDPQTSIMHIGGASSDPAKIAARQKSVYAWQARYMLQRKCYGRIAAGLVRMMDIVGSGLRTIKLRFTGRRKTMEYETQSQILSMLIRPLRAKAG